MNPSEPNVKQNDMNSWADTPQRRRIKSMARTLCQQAGEDPDDWVTIPGDYGYHVYQYPAWTKFIGPAEKQLADEPRNDVTDLKDESNG